MKKTYYINQRAFAHRSSNGEYLVCSPAQLEASKLNKKNFVEVETVSNSSTPQFDTFNKNLLEIERLVGILSFVISEIRGAIRR